MRVERPDDDNLVLAICLLHDCTFKHTPYSLLPAASQHAQAYDNVTGDNGSYALEQSRQIASATMTSQRRPQMDISDQRRPMMRIQTAQRLLAEANATTALDELVSTSSTYIRGQQAVILCMPPTGTSQWRTWRDVMSAAIAAGRRREDYTRHPPIVFAVPLDEYG